MKADQNYGYIFKIHYFIKKIVIRKKIIQGVLFFTAIVKRLSEGIVSNGFVQYCLVERALGVEAMVLGSNSDLEIFPPSWKIYSSYDFFTKLLC